VPDLNDDDESDTIIDRVDDSVAALPEPILVSLIREFFQIQPGAGLSLAR
jgi:hypothetical protein